MSSNLTAQQLNGTAELPQRVDHDARFWVYNRKPFVIPGQPIRTLRMSGVSANAECPCGSGKKYRKCCRPAFGQYTTLQPERFNAKFRGAKGRPW